MATKITDVEFKRFSLKLDGEPDDEGRFTGYAAVFGNVDLGNDVIEPGAFTKTLQENPAVPILWNHRAEDLPIGVSALMAQDTKGLKVEGQLDLNTQMGREVHSLMRLGAIKSMSIGYRTIKRSFKGAVRHLQELALGEFSLVNFPMNPLAEVDGVKSDRKYYGLYSEVTEGVGCLLQMIACGTDFLASEVQEGDAADAGRMQSILSSLADILTSELAEVGGDAADADDAPIEEMRSHVARSIKSLEALLTTPEPADATHGAKGAAPTTEPATAALLEAGARAMRAALHS